MVHEKREHTQHEARDGNQNGGTLEFIPSRPSAFVQFLTRLVPVVAEARNRALPPKDAEHRDNHGAPDKNCRQLAHKNKLLVGGEGGIRTPVGLAPKAVFKTAAIDHSATSPSFADWLAEP